MRKLISWLLAAAMLLTLLPAAVFAATPQSFTFSGDGTWLETSMRADNIKDYTLEFDVSLPLIAGVTGTDAWADEGKIAIRNESTDEYIYFRVMTYRNGSGQYQIASAANVWTGSDWSGEDFLWSSSYETPFAAVHMKINYKDGAYSWAVTSTDGSVAICSGAVTPDHLREGILTCASAQLLFSRSSNDMAVTNAVLTYVDKEPAPEGEQMIFTGDGDWQDTTVRADNTKDYTIDFDVSLPMIAGVTGTDAWADEGKIIIRNESTDEYIYFRVMAYRNGSGQYQIASAANVWTGSDWSGEDFLWSSSYETPFAAVHMKINYKDGAYSWAVTSTDGSVAICNGTVTPAHLREGILSCTSAQIRFCRNSLDMAVSNGVFAYAKDEPAPQGEEIVFTGDGEWQDTTVRADNTKDYTIDFDVSLPMIAGVTGTDAWADEGKIIIRNESTDEYIYFRVMAYRNGSGQYQIASAANVWTGSDWSGEDFLWSSSYETPFAAVHVKIDYKDGAYSWAVTSTDGSVAICNGTVTPDHLREGILTCNSAQIRFYRNSLDMAVSNAVLTYTEEPSGDEEFDVIFTGGDWMNANISPNNTKNYIFSADLYFPAVSTCTTPDTWCDKAQFVIRNTAADHYFIFEVESYVNGEGNYQIATSAQVWNGDWSDRPFEWSDASSTVIDQVSITLTYNKDTRDYKWTATDKATGTLLKECTFSGANVTDELAACTACEFKMYRNSNDLTVSNATLRYVDEIIEPCTHANTEIRDAVDATCTEDGYTGDTYCLDCGEKIAEGEVIPATGHTPGEPVKENEVAATCTAAGGYDTVIYCTVCEAEISRDHTDIPALGHDYELTGWNWNGVTSAEAVFTCKNDTSHVETVVATIESVRTEPTAEENGSIVYTASVTFEDVSYSDSKTEILPALGHDYELSAWDWTDYTAATATFTDKNGGDPITINASITSVRTEPTCVEAGKVDYTASVIFDGVTYTDTMMEPLPALGHTPGEPVKENEVAATCTTAGGYDTVVYCTVCETEISRDHTDIPALGHDWNEPTYVWAEDNGSVTATRTCKRDESHVETEQVNTTSEVTKEATYEEEGEITYTATFTNPAFATQVKKVATPKLVKPDLSNPFIDVKDSDYFYDAVLWAVNAEPQITNGTGATTFSPNDTCTRAQVVTFLWRAKGCPEPTKSENPFKDVKATDYFYKAVLWAVENEITNGTSANTFSPNAGCTRGQVVTFLWRAEGKPAPASTLNPFGDVKSGEFYYDAVLWAVEKDITKGTSDTTFSPSATCTRGQIVTFLYRDLA